MLTVQNWYPDRYDLKQVIQQSGTSADSLTIANATLVGRMVDGPLKEAWSAYYVDIAAARYALLWGPQGCIYATLMGSVAGAQWACDVGLDGSHLPTLIIHGEPTDGTAIIELLFRHSIGR